MSHSLPAADSANARGGGGPPAAPSSPPLPARRPLPSKWLDPAFRGLTTTLACLVLALIAAMGVVLYAKGHLSVKTFGLPFLWGQSWDPVGGNFGALPMIYGTVVSSAIALLLATPVALGVAIFLTEMAPPWLARPVGIAIEMLAAIPSIIYGMWGLFVFAPFMAQHVEPVLQKLVPGPLFSGPPMGIGVLPASVILAVMILPFISSVMRDVFALVPSVTKESAYGLGATTWEVVRAVVIPTTRSGIIGGVFLGLGRALGETMAVTFVIGNAHRISPSLLEPGSTIASTLANEFSEAISDLHVSSLIQLGFILFLITTLILAAAKLLLWRIEAQVKR